ncbi:GntR family transcriptional regulator [Alkalihalobacillus pseudalcaliphilus]|uniref:GntR family transcriptional regulator n=1 Tax=Alkalihalobacillus pseudalcaliphilus TaxID=79884 RepID=UPI00064DF70A|nr:GntR family transcriptional regulator [Alkalihalobacillus pseudalcaliphilus]KMK78034.1 GntR family transcriptional regulator [Alkalihalobacillus pseudalcaliphilus]
MLNHIKYTKTTRDYVYKHIRELIMSLELPPGTSISEKEIAEKLQVSRTPVREAFLRLSEDELLNVLPQRGTLVTLIDLEHVDEARFLREQAEVGMMKLACHTFSEKSMEQLDENIRAQKKARNEEDEQLLFQLDHAFHRILAEGVNKLRVWHVVQKMDTHSNRLRKLSMDLKFNWEKLVDQHEAMVEAIKKQDSVKAEKLMRAHLTLLQYDQVALKVEYPEYFN